MKIKRTFAPDIRQAIRKVRDEQGPDAVILGNRKVNGGVEIISALDYDEDVIYEALDRKAAVSAQEPNHASPAQNRQTQPNSYSARTYADVAQNMNENIERQPPQDDFTRAPRQVSQAPIFDHGKDLPSSVNDSLDHGVQRGGAAAELTSQPTQARAMQAQVQQQALAKARRAQQQSAASKPVMDDMRRDIKALRGLMEDQLSVLEWNRVAKRHPTRIALLNRFNEMDLGTDLAQKIVDQVKDISDLDRAWRLGLATLAKRIPIGDDDLLNFGGVVALVGATGVGKTTTVAKLAARFAMQHGQRNVALVTTDTYRIGAQEQLLNFARILGVPLHTANDHDELGRILAGLYDKKLVLIDTAGMSQRDLRLTEQFATLKESSPIIRTYLVMSANTQLAAMDEVVRTFGSADLAGAIVTKLDEAANLGGAITVAIRHQLPIVYVATGQRVPEDLQPARAHRLVSRAVPLSQRHGEVSDEDAIALKFAGMNYAGTAGNASY